MIDGLFEILFWVLIYFVIALPIAIFVGTVIRRMGEDDGDV